MGGKGGLEEECVRCGAWDMGKHKDLPVHGTFLAQGGAGAAHRSLFGGHNPATGSGMLRSS